MTSFCFGLFSDLHANLPGLPERGYGGRSMEDLARGLARFRDAGVRFAVSLGDNTQPARTPMEQRTQLEDMAALWNGYGFPVRPVFGNHEFQQLGLEEVLSAFRREDCPDRYYSFTEEGVRFIVLDTNVNPDGTHFAADNFDWRYGIVDDAQLAWLGDLLKEKVRSVVFAHSPLYWETGDPHDDWFRVLNHREVRSLLEASGCVEAVFQGHHHTFHADRHNGIPYLNIPSPEQAPAYSDDCFPIVRISEDGLTLNGLSYR